MKQQALDLAQKLYDDNRNQVQLGTLQQIEVTRAAAEVSARREDLLQSQTNVAQQETVLKNALSRNAAAECLAGRRAYHPSGPDRGPQDGRPSRCWS